MKYPQIVIKKEIAWELEAGRWTPEQIIEGIRKALERKSKNKLRLVVDCPSGQNNNWKPFEDFRRERE